MWLRRLQLYGDISHGLWWITSPFFILYCASFEDFKETNLKSNNFADGMDHNHPDWLLSFVWQHNLFTILYNFFFAFFLFRMGPPPLPSTFWKVSIFCKGHISFINFPLWLVICKLRKCIKHRYWSCPVSTISLLRLLGGISSVHPPFRNH